MPYHVMITPKNPSDRHLDDAVALDRDAAWIEEHVARPWRQGNAIFIDGRKIGLDKIDRICITETKETIDQLMANIRKTPGVPMPAGWEIARDGLGVTEQFITGSPGAEPHAEVPARTTGSRVFIGHGHSAAWRELKDFIKDRLGLEFDEFNRVPVAGVGTSERLWEMLNNASMAFLVCTAEDEHADGTHHARENVIHEAGLFQGRLGFKRAIVVLEEGTTEFSNITGLGHLRFPKEHIGACFEDVRQVLEREGLISSK